MRTAFETATEQFLGEPVQAAAFVKYPGWFQEQAIKKQFRGPLAFAFHKATSHIGKVSREAGQARLALAGMPAVAVLAVTEAGVRVVRVSVSAMTGAVHPEECVATMATGTYSARTEEQTFTLLLAWELPGGRQVEYECSRFGTGASSVKALERIVADGRPADVDMRSGTTTVEKTRP